MERMHFRLTLVASIVQSDFDTLVMDMDFQKPLALSEHFKYRIETL